jgi:2-polyprenyl-6-methoxyphenol hydroxylase-like FAD-dependent oxidoreductase
MLAQNKKIAIVGAGIGGLTLARFLQMQNVEINVYERDTDKDARSQGTTPLDLHEESGLEAIHRADLTEEFQANYRPESGIMRIVDKDFNLKYDEHELGKSHSEHRPEIDRVQLRNILLDSLESGTVVWDRHFVSMENKNKGRLLHFKNGTSAYADIVIAADGANTKVRPYISDIEPIYCGVTFIEGSIAHASKNAATLFKFTKGGKVLSFDDEKSLVLGGAKVDGSMQFLMGFKVPENQLRQKDVNFNNTQSVFNWFKKAYSSWSEILHELFMNDEVYFIPRPQYYYPPEQTWETMPDITMLGDAAHLMPPLAGQGANLAMQDVLELAECLTGDTFSDIKTAFAYFEKEMLKRSSFWTKVTLDNTEKMYSKGALARILKMFGEQ